MKLGWSIVTDIVTGRFAIGSSIVKPVSDRDQAERLAEFEEEYKRAEEALFDFSTTKARSYLALLRIYKSDVLREQHENRAETYVIIALVIVIVMAGIKIYQWTR